MIHKFFTVDGMKFSAIIDDEYSRHCYYRGMDRPAKDDNGNYLEIPVELFNLDVDWDIQMVYYPSTNVSEITDEWLVERIKEWSDAVEESDLEDRENAEAEELEEYLNHEGAIISASEKSMTVGELITLLSKFDKNDKLIMSYYNGEIDCWEADPITGVCPDSYVPNVIQIEHNNEW